MSRELSENDVWPNKRVPKRNKVVKRNQIEILEFKTIVMWKMKSPEGLKSRSVQAEERVNMDTGQSRLLV